MSNLVFIFETMECDWDSDKVVRGVFSDANEAVKYIRSNYFLLDNERDVCIPDYPIEGDIFIQYGYEAHPHEVNEDSDGLYYWEEDYEGSWRNYLNITTVFTLRGVVLDGLLD